MAKNIVPCIGEGCPLCAKGHKAQPQLVLKDLRTGKKFIPSPKFTERLRYAIGDQHKKEKL